MTRAHDQHGLYASMITCQSLGYESILDIIYILEL